MSWEEAFTDWWSYIYRYNFVLIEFLNLFYIFHFDLRHSIYSLIIFVHKIIRYVYNNNYSLY